MISNDTLIKLFMRSWEYKVGEFKILQFKDDIFSGFFNARGCMTWTRLTLSDKGKEFVKAKIIFDTML